MQKPLHLDVVGVGFEVSCADALSRAVIETCYRAFVVATDASREIAETYRIEDTGDGWILHCEDKDLQCPSLADLIYDFEKEMTIRLQLVRHELLYVHGAAVASGDRCLVIAGESGAGKSTLCWAMCNAGFDYMSDELAPIDPASRTVEPYPHALCMKQWLQGGPLPDGTIDAGRTLHVPVAAIPGSAASNTRRLAGLLFVDASGESADGSACRIGSAEAAARLYANSLNQLAHGHAGMAAVTAIASAVPAYRLGRSAPDSMVEAAAGLLQNPGIAA